MKLFIYWGMYKIICPILDFPFVFIFVILYEFVIKKMLMYYYDYPLEKSIPAYEALTQHWHRHTEACKITKN
jgi:hypothetical protein